MQEDILDLPQITFSFHQPLPKHEYLLVAGGRSPKDSWLKASAAGRTLWCIDHGIDCCYAARLLPEHLFGDGDSASPEAWHWAESQDVPIEKYQPEKDFTDTQLALQYASHDPDAMIVLTGCFGKRFDHFYSTLFSCAYSRMPVCLADELEVLFPLPGGNAMTVSPVSAPLAVSLLPLTSTCEGVCIDNVRWPLQDAELKQSFPNAVSNVPATGKPITVSLSSGILGVYLCWD